MDVRSMMVAGITVSGTEDEDPAQYFDSYEDAGEMLDPPIDNVETDEAMKATELDALAEFGVCGIVDMHVAFGKK